MSGTRYVLRDLIIDADKENRELLIALLRHLGCTVTAAAGLQTAGASLAASTFDLVLVDVRLPEPELAGIAHIAQVGIVWLTAPGRGERERGTGQ